MFSGANAFNNGGTSGTNPLIFDTSKCTSFASTFQNATAFNQQIIDPQGGSWNTSRCTTMASMFSSATAFNNGETGNTGANPMNWSAQNCLTFASMFRSANNFNQSLPNLVDTSGLSGIAPNVCTIASMFQFASKFNNGNSDSIKNWKTIYVTSFNSLFYGASVFAQPVNSNILNNTWITSNVTDMGNTFQSANAFNQPLDLWDTSKVINMANMFNSNTGFNQNISGWNTSNVGNMGAMFSSATVFNNGVLGNLGGQPLTWTASKCIFFNQMFNSAGKFNQELPTLVSPEPGFVAATTLNNMFVGATLFNNGEPPGLRSIPSVTASTSSYSHSTRILTCPGATLTTQSLVIGDTIVFSTSTTTYFSTILSFTDTTITFNTNTNLPTANIASGISLVQKSFAGSTPLNWNTTNVNNMSFMFQNCTSFNQNITTSGSYWNTNKVTTVISQFQGTNATTGKGLFNNGQVVGGITAPMGWVFAAGATKTNFRTNSYLTNGNTPTGT